MDPFGGRTLRPRQSDSHSTKRDRSPSASRDARKRIHTDIEPAANSPDDQVKPQLAWSKTRQALCDALPFFKAHRGGTYSKKKKIHGILIGGFLEPRDYFGRDIIITTIGGGREQNDDGKWVRVSSQRTARRLGDWTEAWKHQFPIGIIIDKQHDAFKTLDLSTIDTPDSSTISYVVLSFFFVTNIWQELVQPEDHDEPYTVSKLMLQRINIETAPIYWKDKSQIARHDGKDTSNSRHDGVCETCKRPSPQAFVTDTFVCLNQDCQSFFRDMLSGSKLDARTVEYNPVFLGHIENYRGSKDDIPNIFQPAPKVDENGFGTEKALRSGMTCPRCGACSRRITWDGWSCENCSFNSKAFPSPYPLEKVKEEICDRISKLRSEDFAHDHTTIMIDRASVEKRHPQVEGETIVTEYILRNDSSEVIGTLVHSRPSEDLRASLNGADKLFKEIQEKDIGLQRYASRCAGSVAEVMTRNFVGNWGFPYQFGVKVPTKSFAGAPEVVLKAMAQLTYYGKQAVELSQRTVMNNVNNDFASVKGSDIMEPWTPYNEQLILGYMEDDSISWHDDGEAQLSGTITTICLGSPAEMHLRMKGQKKANLKIQLFHGDSVTMCGTQLQRFTDHQVVPTGVRRFALTGRAISRDYYDDKKGQRKLMDLFGLTPEEAREAGELPMRAERFLYPCPVTASAASGAQDEEAGCSQ